MIKQIKGLQNIQSETGKIIINKYSIDINKNDSIILISNGNVSYRSKAVFTILFYLNTFWRILLIFSVLPSPIRDLFYRIIAKSRYKIFGRNKKFVGMLMTIYNQNSYQVNLFHL